MLPYTIYLLLLNKKRRKQMLEDVFEKIASTPNPAGQELLEILQEKRPEYEKYPEPIVLRKVFKEYLKRHNRNSSNEYNSEELTHTEINQVFYDIYNGNNYAKEGMQDRFVNKSTRQEYWENAYTKEKYDEFCQQHQETAQNPTTFIVRPKTSKITGKYGNYWERFFYDKNKETAWRITLNVKPERQLLEQIDEFAQKYQCAWKYVNTVNDYNRRKDPIIIYLPKETLNDREKILKEIHEISTPYVRKDNYNIYGYQNYGNGVFHAEHTTQARLSNALFNCFDKDELEQIKKLTFFDEIKEFNQQSQNPDPIRQYVINTIATNPQTVSGGHLALLEWLTELNKVAHTSVLFHNKDGSTVQKHNDIVFKKDKDNQLLWHRVYQDNYRHIKEREFSKPNTSFGDCIINIYQDGKKQR